MPITSTSPQIADQFSPLETLAMRALRRYGETAPSTVEGEAILDFIDHANWVIDQLHVHPYWPEGQEIAYFDSQTERRPIPDHVLLAGLLAKHALENGSSKAATYMGLFNQTMGAVLHRVMFGVNPRYEMQVVDYPTSEAGQ